MNKRVFIFTGLIIASVLIASFFLRTDIENAIPSQSSKIVELKDGDTYVLEAGFIKKEIGNRTYTMLAYNGSIPGPLIKVAQGSEITIVFKNNTGIEQTLHSHGIRLDNQFDGAPDVTQSAVPSGESFTYKIKFPDAGIYWYHPHVREDYAQELGLYGNYFVTPTDIGYWSSVNREIPIFLDDILIENGMINLSKTVTDHAMNGRYGNIMLVNGETNYSLSIKKGELVRFYITNVANVRPFNFTIQGAKMKLVGADSGAYEHEEWRDSVVIAPSERVIVEVLFEKSGVFDLQNKIPGRTYLLGRVHVTEDAVDVSYASDFRTLKTSEKTVASIDPFRQYFTKAPDKKITLSIDMMGGMMGGMGMMGGGSRDIHWEDSMQMMNAMSNTDMVKWRIIDQETGNENADIDWKFKVGDKVKIRIFNDPKSAHPMQHPIHFHGQRFLVLSRGGVPETNLVWKDTTLVRVGETVDILVDVSNPGVWMAHCHIAEHLESGMMFTFRVE